MHTESFEHYKQIQEFVNLFDQPHPDFSKFTTVPGLDVFVQQNKDELEQLSKFSKIVEKVMSTHIKPNLDKIIGQLEQINVDKETQKIVMRERTQAEIFEGINEKFGTGLQDFEDKVSSKKFEIFILNQVSKVTQSLDKLRGLAVGLNAKGCPVGKNGSTGMDKVLNSLSFLLEYYERLNQIVGYYSMVFAEAERLKNILQDSSTARNQNRNNLLEDARSQQTAYNQMAQGAMNMMSNMGNAFASSWQAAQQQSTYGVPGQNQNRGQQPQGYGRGLTPSTFGGGAPQQSGYNPYGNFQQAPQNQNPYGSHMPNNSPYVGGQTSNPFVVQSQNNPYGQPNQGQNPYGSNPFGNNPYGQNPYGGNNNNNNNPF